MARPGIESVAWWVAVLLAAVGCRGAPVGSSPLTLGPIVDRTPAAELATDRFSRREVACRVCNETPDPIEIRRLRPTVSTTVTTDRGMPPFTLAPGESVLLSIRATNHDAEPRTRRVEIEFDGGVSRVLIPVEAARRPRAGFADGS